MSDREIGDISRTLNQFCLFLLTLADSGDRIRNDEVVGSIPTSSTIPSSPSFLPIYLLPEMTMRNVLLLLAVGVVVAGCRSRPTFHVTVNANLCCDVQQYKLTVNGTEAGPFAALQAYEFDAPATAGSDEPLAMMPAIRAQVRYVCGWQDVQVALYPPSRAAIEHAKGPLQVQALVDFQAPTFAEVSVWVDNRGGGDAVLSLGETKRSVAAGAATSVQFPYYPKCDEAKIMRLNGGVIADLPVEPKKIPAYLVDTSGSRCYTLRMKDYVVSSIFASPQPKPEYVSKQKAHALTNGRGVDYFQEAAPNSITTMNGNGFSASRLSVMDARCK
ncbi:MAG: hypothetical protein M3P27_00865 [Acidobacteriota bacterium]|nr:hypothetical protein [Acidobacteriota bacterium]